MTPPVPCSPPSPRGGERGPGRALAVLGGLAVAAAALPAVGRAPLAPLAPTPPTQAGQIAYESFILPNGLRVLSSEDRSTPIVTVDVWYNVGSRNERPGRSGFAHLFEHMMFEGSAHVPKAMHGHMIKAAGGSDNASTTEDRTNYYETVPSNYLNVVLWLEADRMRSLAVTAANLENQRATVKEERRLRFENEPYTAAFIDGLTWPFDSARCFAYAHPVIGSMADVDAAQLADLQAFFHAQYVPNNATLAVTGDFRPRELRRLVNAYFADIPAAPVPRAPTCEYRLSPGVMRREVADAHANLPAALRYYRLPAHDHPDGAALDLLNIVLGEGESSRLNGALVRHDHVALQVGSDTQNDRRGPGVLVAYAVANQGVAVERLDSLLGVALDSLRTGGVTASELARAQSTFRANYVHARETTWGRAEALQHYDMFHTSVAEINTDLDRHLAVTAGDLQRVARAYLDLANAVIVLVRPKPSAADTAGAR